MKTRLPKYILAVVTAMALQGPVRAGELGDFHFPLGLSFSSGHIEVFDKIDDLYNAAGWHTHDKILVPVGLTFSPYYEFGFGLGLGATIGPTAIYSVHEDTGGGPPPPGHHNDDYKTSYIVPIGADVRYTFLRRCDISPYLKVGVRYPLTGGDNLGSSEVGPYGAVGVEFFRNRRIGMGVEFGYDASRVKVEGPSGSGLNERVTFSGFTGTIFVLF